jgi:DNA-binding transcriptional ArsR family regulator
MGNEELFVSLTSLICEPARAKMLWNLLDGRAYTASELAIVSDISATSASNHLSKLLEGDIIKLEVQGRHRYYSFSRPEIAYVVESLASLATDKRKESINLNKSETGIRFCRTCYDHLAGYVGVKLAEALEQNKLLIKTASAYDVSAKGWRFFSEFHITKEDFGKSRRQLTRQCLDWSERKPHLAGQLGAALLKKMVERKWFKNVRFSRELIVTFKGHEELYKLLGIKLQ